LGNECSTKALHREERRSDFSGAGRGRGQARLRIVLGSYHPLVADKRCRSRAARDFSRGMDEVFPDFPHFVGPHRGGKLSMAGGAGGLALLPHRPLGHAGPVLRRLPTGWWGRCCRPGIAIRGPTGARDLSLRSRRRGSGQSFRVGSRATRDDIACVLVKPDFPGRCTPTGRTGRADSTLIGASDFFRTARYDQGPATRVAAPAYARRLVANPPPASCSVFDEVIPGIRLARGGRSRSYSTPPVARRLFFFAWCAMAPNGSVARRRAAV